MLQVIIVICHAHRGKGRHCGQAFFQAIGESMNGDESGIARFHQLVVFVRREIARQGHETILEKRIDGPCRIDRELRVKFYRLLQVALALHEHGRHLLEARRRGKGAVARRIVFFFQQRENPVRAFAHVNLRISFFGLEDATAKVESFELGAKQHPIDPVFLRPLRGWHRADLVQ